MEQSSKKRSRSVIVGLTNNASADSTTSDSFPQTSSRNHQKYRDHSVDVSSNERTETENKDSAIPHTSTSGYSGQTKEHKVTGDCDDRRTVDVPDSSIIPELPVSQPQDNLYVGVASAPPNAENQSQRLIFVNPDQISTLHSVIQAANNPVLSVGLNADLQRTNATTSFDPLRVQAFLANPQASTSHLLAFQPRVENLQETINTFQDPRLQQSLFVPQIQQESSNDLRQQLVQRYFQLQLEQEVSRIQQPPVDLSVDNFLRQLHMRQQQDQVQLLTLPQLRQFLLHFNTLGFNRSQQRILTTDLLQAEGLLERRNWLPAIDSTNNMNPSESIQSVIQSVSSLTSPTLRDLVVLPSIRTHGVDNYVSSATIPGGVNSTISLSPEATLTQVLGNLARNSLATAILPMEFQASQGTQASNIVVSASRRFDCSPESKSNMSNSEVPNDERDTAVSLAFPSDSSHLSEYQILLRQQLEFFTAKKSDAESNIQGRKKSVRVGQVGIRCRHCAHLPLRQRGRGAVYYTTKLSGVYQAAQNMALSHLNRSCSVIPPEIRQNLVELHNRRDTAGGGKQYWADCCQSLGLYDEEYGIRFQSP